MNTDRGQNFAAERCLPVGLKPAVSVLRTHNLCATVYVNDLQSGTPWQILWQVCGLSTRS